MMPTRRSVLAAGLSGLATPALGATAGDYAATLSQAYGAPVDAAAAHGRALAAATAAQARADALLKAQGLSAGAYFEAWGTYAEQLCCDLGAYAHDPLGEIGYLQWRLFRLARIVADTGVHALGWSRERAVAEMTDLQGQSIAFITIAADVDRI